MILTWLWKIFLAFRRGRETAALEASKGPPTLSAARPEFVHQSSDKNNRHVVIFEGDDTAPPSKRQAKA
jgi:hypothetical protein